MGDRRKKPIEWLRATGYGGLEKLPGQGTAIWRENGEEEGGKEGFRLLSEERDTCAEERQGAGVKVGGDDDGALAVGSRGADEGPRLGRRTLVGMGKCKELFRPPPSSVRLCCRVSKTPHPKALQAPAPIHPGLR